MVGTLSGKLVNQQLGRFERYEEYKEIIHDDLCDIAEILTDPAFSKMVEKINLESDDAGLAQVKSAIAYVCEDYRLERRVIRNRRQAISGEMASRTLSEVSYRPLTNNETYNESGAIQATLAFLSANGAEDEEYVQTVAIPLFSALFSSPRAFSEKLENLKYEDHFQCYEIQLFDIIELIPTKEQEQEIERMKSVSSNLYSFATAEEIKALGINTAENQLRETIGSHTQYILQENEQLLMSMKDQGKVFDVALEEN